MANDLINPDQLNGQPGAPFTQAAVDAAVATLRRMADWHIAPQRTETLTLDGSETRLLVVPTLRLTSVTAVRDVSGSAPLTLSGWRASQAGMIRRAAGWPCGFGVLEVDVVHGYANAPADLLPAIAALCELAAAELDVQQESLGAWSVTARDSLAQAHAETIEAYALPRLR